MYEEEWKWIVGYEGSYEISSLGKVRSYYGIGSQKKKILVHPREKKTHVSKRGYYMVSLCRKPHYIHRLIAIAFIENPHSRNEINHKNAIKTDNRIENLEWCSHLENVRHAFILGLCRNPNPLRGMQMGTSKLTNADVKNIRAEYIHGERGVTSETSQAGLAKKYKVDPSLIGQVVRRKIWKHI